MEPLERVKGWVEREGQVQALTELGAGTISQN